MSSTSLDDQAVGPDAREQRRYGVDDVPHFLGTDRVDDVARMVTQLANEVWVLRDQLQVMERLLTDGGALQEGAVEQYQPDGAFREHLAADRTGFVERVFGAPFSLGRRMAAAVRRRGEQEKQA